MLLDIQASQAVAQAKLFELVVNSTGPWAVRIGDRTEWAVKIRTDAGITFVAYFDDGAEDTVAWLLHRGEEVSSREVTPLEEAFTLDWRVRLASTQTDSDSIRA